ncbi:MAG: PQQ-binding-like beta-propeller repeat protein, partial [Vallitaleaceae bacterium]|nr:PQQ-binding-like beta-propeller repeat protein [Vallitaleaceae bacterium]
MPEFGYEPAQKNNWYTEGRLPDNSNFLPIDFNLDRAFGYDPLVAYPFAVVGDTFYSIKDADIFAIDTKTLRIKWQFRAVGPGNYSALLAAWGNLVIIALTEKLFVLEDKGDRYEVKWTHSVSGESFNNNVTFDDQTIFYTLYRGETLSTPPSSKIVAHNAFTGAFMWQYIPNGDAETLAGGGHLFIRGRQNTSNDFKTIALSPIDGTVDWERTLTFDTRPSIDGSMVYSDNLLYMYEEQSGQKEIVALDTATGNIVWQHTTDTPTKNFLGGNLTVNDEIVLYLNEYEYMVALDKKTGAVKWKAKYYPAGVYSKQVYGRPILTNSQIFLS